MIYVQILLLLAWVAYAVLEGWREATYFHKVMDTTKKDGRRLHFWWNVQRAIVVAVMFAVWPSWWVIGLGLMFPFFHDGMYYETRNYLKRGVYPKGWFDHSSTSTALLSRFETPAMRIVFAGHGLALVIADMIW